MFFIIVFGLLFGTGVFSQSQDEEDVVLRQLEYTRAHYTKYDYAIPMRDGVKLFHLGLCPERYESSLSYTDETNPLFHRPVRDRQLPLRSSALPRSLRRKVLSLFTRMCGDGIFRRACSQTCPIIRRGFPARPTRTRTTDTYDTIDWLVKHVPSNNGRVGIWGISYPGFFAAFGMIDAHPALKAASPQAPVGDVADGDDAFHNGAFFLAANFGFYSVFKPRPDGPARPERWARFDFGTPDAYDFFLRMGPLSNSNDKYFKNENPYWNANLEHPNYDEYWQARSLVPHMKNIKPAVLFVGGWFDAEDLAGPLKLFYALEKNGPLGPNTLVMGPWLHGGWADMDGDRLGNLRFGSKTGEFYRETIELPFFVYHLKGKGDGLKPPNERPSPKPGYSRPERTNGGSSMPGRPGKRGKKLSISVPEASSGLSRRRTKGWGLRRIHQRSGEAGSRHRPYRRGHAGGLHDRGSAVRFPEARRPRL